MSVYRRREPDNSSKIARRYNYKQVGRDLFFFMLEHRRFRFFPCLLEQPGKQSSAHSPSSKYTTAATCSASFSPLFSLTRTAVNTAGALHFLPVTMNTRSKTDEKERRSNAVGEDRSLSRKSSVFFFRISFSYTSMFSYFLPFQFEIKHCAILLPWKLFLSNESRSFCTRLFLFRFINRNRNTAQKEYALRKSGPIL